MSLYNVPAERGFIALIFFTVLLIGFTDAVTRESTTTMDAKHLAKEGFKIPNHRRCHTIPHAAMTA